MVLHLLAVVLLILIASALDHHLTVDVRPEKFYRSQFLVGFASGMFLVPYCSQALLVLCKKALATW